MFQARSKRHYSNLLRGRVHKATQHLHKPFMKMDKNLFSMVILVDISYINRAFSIFMSNVKYIAQCASDMMKSKYTLI